MRISNLIILGIALISGCLLIWTHLDFPSKAQSRDGLSGKAAFDEKRYEQAFQLLSRACDAQDLEACSNLGLMYEDGLATKQDVSRANKLYKNSCDAGNGRGCALLGFSYGTGSGFKKDLNRAQELYTKACDLKNGTGCTNLGSTQYEFGKFAEAVSFFERACSAGSGRGCNNLAIMRQSGEGVQIDLNASHQLSERACQLGNGQGCNRAGLNLWDGTGVRQNYQEARAYFELACKAKYDPECANLNKDQSLAPWEAFLIETERNRLEAAHQTNLERSLAISFACLLLGVCLGKLLDFNYSVRGVSKEVIEKIVDPKKYSLLEIENMLRPRWLIWSAIIILTCALGIVVYSALELAAYPATFCILAFLISVWVSRRFVPPKAGNQFYIEWIYSNVQNRYANYVRDKDSVRAAQLLDLMPIIQGLRHCEVG